VAVIGTLDQLTIMIVEAPGIESHKAQTTAVVMAFSQVGLVVKRQELKILDKNLNSTMRVSNRTPKAITMTASNSTTSSLIRLLKITTSTNKSMLKRSMIITTMTSILTTRSSPLTIPTNLGNRLIHSLQLLILTFSQDSMETLSIQVTSTSTTLLM